MAAPSMLPGLGFLAQGAGNIAQQMMSQPGQWGTSFTPTGMRSPNQFGFQGMGGARPTGTMATPSGRSYLDQNRMGERYARWNDRMFRQQMAGGRSGGSRGGSAGPMQPGNPYGINLPVAQGQINPNMTSQDMADMGQINQAGGMGMVPQDVGMARARIQGGVADVGDFGLLRQRTATGWTPEANSAYARQQFKQYQGLGYGRPLGLVGAAQQALFGVPGESMF